MFSKSYWESIIERLLHVSKKTIDIRAGRELRELVDDLKSQQKSLSAKSRFSQAQSIGERYSTSQDAVTEDTPTSNLGDPANHSLQLRIRQQEILAELGVLALQGASFDELLEQTTRLVAEGLRAEFSKVLEYIPKQQRLLVRAGIGWDKGVIGTATVGADLASPAGFALKTHKPVISNHLENEKRFRTPELLVEHGIRRAMNVILQGDGSPFGVLEVDSRSGGDFSEHDLSFLQGAANILGMAIERQRYESNLQAALEQQQVLLAEVNHRVKNSLQVVSSLLQIQAAAATDHYLRAQLEEASHRVATVGRAYERLAYDGQYKTIDLGAYLREVVNDLAATNTNVTLKFEAIDSVSIASDSAIPIALIVNELVTNAAKYAYPGKSDGIVLVQAARIDENSVSVLVRDEGVGLPSDFYTVKRKGLGARLVKALSLQL